MKALVVFVVIASCCTTENRSQLSTFFAVSAFDLHCQVGKSVEAMWSINHCTVVSYGMQPNKRPC